MPVGYDIEMMAIEEEAAAAERHSRSAKHHSNGNGIGSNRPDEDGRKSKRGKRVVLQDILSRPVSRASSLAAEAEERIGSRPSEAESRRISVPLLVISSAVLILIVYIIYIKFFAQAVLVKI